MSRKNINSKELHAYTEEGVYIGTWQSITDAALANNVSTSSISTGLTNKDHFSVGRYWVYNKEDIFYSMLLHQEKVKKELEQKQKREELKNKTTSKIQITSERHGDYVFVASNLSGDDCCKKCALYDLQCLPCRTHEKHDNGYWIYKKQNRQL